MREPIYRGWCEEVEFVEHSQLVSPCLDGSRNSGDFSINHKDGTISIFSRAGSWRVFQRRVHVSLSRRQMLHYSWCFKVGWLRNWEVVLERRRRRRSASAITTTTATNSSGISRNLWHLIYHQQELLGVLMLVPIIQHLGLWHLVIPWTWGQT